MALQQPKGSVIGILKDGKSIQEKFDLLSGNTGASLIGTSSGNTVQQELNKFNCTNVVALRSLEPTVPGQSVYLLSVDAASGNRSGGEMFYDSLDTTSADDGVTVIVTTSGKRWKRVESYIDMAWFGAYSTKDFADVWDQAVGVVDSFVRTNGVYGRKTIYLGPGTYKPSRQLDIPSWVSVVAIGNVTIDGSTLADESYVCRIINKVSGISTTYHSGWNLGSIGGTLYFTGKTKTGNVDGLFVGNTSATSDCRNVKLVGVSVGGTRTALTFGSINTYLFTAERCHFESSKVGLSIPNSTSANSGERMVFEDCIFGGSDTNHVQMSTPGMDLTFNSCSFDFTNGNVIYGSSTWGYSKVSLNNCHTEGYDGLLLKVDSPQGSSVGTNRSITISNHVNLPRLRQNVAGTNSPSRVHIDAKSTPVYISGFDQRHEVVPYTEDTIFASSETTLYMDGYLKDPYFQLPHVGFILNRGWNMADETIGVVVNSGSTLDALTRYTCVDRNAMSATVVDRDGTDKMLKITGAGGYINFASKDFIPVNTSSRVGQYLSISAQNSTGNIQCTFSIAWYDINDQLLTTNSVSSINMRTVFNDSTLPNFADGNVRYIATASRTFRAPTGAVKCKPRWQVSGFTGDIYLSRMISFLL